MGKKSAIGTSLAFMLGGAAFFDYAAYEVGCGGIGPLVHNLAHAMSEISPAQVLDVVFTNLGEYTRDFFHDKFAALGTASQVSMYGGLAGLVYNSLRKYDKKPDNKPEE